MRASIFTLGPDEQTLHVGDVTLQVDSAVFSNEDVEQLIAPLTILDPGDPEVTLTPDDGPRYIAALGPALRSPYMWALLEV